MPLAGSDHRPPPSHQALLRSQVDPHHAEATTDSWFRSNVDHRHKMFTVAVPPRPDASATALAPEDLHPSAAPERLVRQALDEGFRGLGILVWADKVLGDTSGEFHDDIETALTALCVDHPVSVLCVYDRPGAGVECLDLAVTQHNAALHEQQITLGRTDDVVHLSGEVDMSNLDVLDAALRATAVAPGRRLRVDLGRLTFLSAGAAHLLSLHVALLRDDGVHVELHRVAPPVGRVLQLIGSGLRSNS